MRSDDADYRVAFEVGYRQIKNSSFRSTGSGHSTCHCEAPSGDGGTRVGLRRVSGCLADDVFSFDAEILRSSQQMSVVRINDAKARFGGSGQVNGVCRSQKHTRWKLLIDLPDSQENFGVLRKPVESSGLNVRPYLSQ